MFTVCKQEGMTKSKDKKVGGHGKKKPGIQKEFERSPEISDNEVSISNHLKKKKKLM